ncbi:MAG: HAMP domain-containing histidine kinase [Anaerolineales bacterium]|nr:HAMP domain-containing histidine kinase [Anaerolineales bacterium]
MINTVEFFLKHRQDWVEESGRMLAINSKHPTLSIAELEIFLDTLIEAMLTGESSVLEKRIDGLLDAPIVFDSLEQALIGYQERGIVSALQALRNAAFALIQKNSDAENALLYQNNLETQFCQIIEYAAYREFAAIIEKITTSQNEIQEAFELLEEARLNFVTIAAQELRTPLTLIEGYTEMLKEMLLSEDLESGPLVSGVESGIQKLRHIIDELVDISMVDTKMLLLHYQPVQINNLLEKAKTEIEDKVAERSQKLDINIFPAANKKVFVDPERLLQAIINVLDNSVKFTPEGGSIVVDGRMLPGFIELTIADTGVGIDPSAQAMIFEKFGSSGRRSEYVRNDGAVPGPGLGLHLAKGIIEAHGGAIWVTSQGYDEELCPGSTFHLMFPYRESPPDDMTARLLGHRQGANDG